MKSLSSLSLKKWLKLSTALEKAGFFAEDIESIIDSKENELAKNLLSTLKENKKLIRLVQSFEDTVPSDFDHKTVLDSHGLFVSSEINSENFKCSSGKINQGEKLKIGIWEVLELKDRKECLDFLLKLPKSVLLGVHGAVFVLKYHSDKLPLGSRVFSLDKPEYLGKQYRIASDEKLYPDPDNLLVVPYINTEEDKEATYGIRIETEKFQGCVEGKYDDDFAGRKIEYLLSFQKI